MPRPIAAPDVFVRAWNAADSLAQLAAELGMTQHALGERARRYRNMGVELKRFGGDRRRLNVEALRRAAGGGA